MSADDDYLTYSLERVLGRLRWLRDEWSDKVWTVGFGNIEYFKRAAEAAVNIAFVDHCPDDAVPYHGRSRMLSQTPWESLAAYRLRIKDAFPFWQNLGPKTVTVDGEVRGLQEAMRFYTGVDSLTIFDIPNDHWDAGDPGTGNDDEDEDNWSRVSVVIPQPHDWEELIAGPGVVAGPELLAGITMTRSEQANIRKTFREHRPGHVIGIDIYVIFDATTAAAVLASHVASASYLRMPLGPIGLAGYLTHGMYAGAALVCGAEIT